MYLETFIFLKSYTLKTDIFTLNLIYISKFIYFESSTNDLHVLYDDVVIFWREKTNGHSI